METEDYGVLDYVPVIGDIYRYGKLGWKIGSWLSDADSSYNLSILSETKEKIDQANNTSDIIEYYKCINEAVLCASRFDTKNAKKFQWAILCYLLARAYHCYALCSCYVYSNNLESLKQCEEQFQEAIKWCNNVWEIDKTLFTEKRSIIDEVRKNANSKKEEINQSISNWRKQYRTLYKKVHPWKWYLGMWIFA